MTIVVDQPLLIDRQKNVLWLRLNRPEARNALSLDLLKALDAALAAAEVDEAVRVVIIAGDANSFCAGADLKALANLDIATDPAAVPRRVQQTLARIRRFPKPAIAAIEGVTVAGGLELAMACDIRIASGDARIGDGHLKAGVIPGAGSAAVLPRLTGSGAAKLLLYTGDLWTATQAHGAGLVDLVIEAGQFEEEVATIAGRIARNSPLGLRVTKRLVDDALMQTVEEALAAELEANLTYCLSDDFVEGMRAFGEKRAPRFTGR